MFTSGESEGEKEEPETWGAWTGRHVKRLTRAAREALERRRQRRERERLSEEGKIGWDADVALGEREKKANTPEARGRAAYEDEQERQAMLARGHRVRIEEIVAQREAKRKADEERRERVAKSDRAHHEQQRAERNAPKYHPRTGRRLTEEERAALTIDSFPREFFED